MYGPYHFIYLINNGLAAYQGYEILNVQPNENILISTASGATGLLLVHLVKKKGGKIVALCSEEKKKYVEGFSDQIINYRDRGVLKKTLEELDYKKYFDNVGESQLDLVL
jgi:NADPH-dependent curcumin reductase CurA